jgi:hypothetical protein
MDNTIGQTEERISKVKDRFSGSTQLVKEWIFRLLGFKEDLRMPERYKGLFKGIVTENFPNLEKDTNIHV